MPATTSARQETSENSNHNEGTDRRQPAANADNATARASNGAHGGSQSSAPEIRTWRLLCLPRNLHMEVHKVLCLPRHLHVKKQVKTLITMKGRTGDNRRNSKCRTWRFTPPEPRANGPAAHGGSQSAAPATKSAHGGSQSAAPATTSARQETSENSNHNGGTDRRPPATTGGKCRQRKCQSL